MSQLLSIFKQYNSIWLALLLVVMAGIVGGYIAATIVLVFFIFMQESSYKEEMLLILFLAIFFLGDNFTGRLGFANNTRFAILGLALVFLFKHDLFNNRLANKLLPFSAIALVITLLYSTLGTAAYLRALAYWLMALVIFKTVDISYKKSAQNTLHIILFWISLFIISNVILYFLPLGFDTYLKDRFRGLMNNPNGLGLVALMCYPFTDLVKQRKETRFPDYFFIGIKVMIVFIAILTASRNTIFSIMIYEAAHRLSKNKPLFIIGLGAILFAYYSISINDVIAIIQQLGLGDFFRVESLLDASGRTEVWEVAWQEAQRSPWLGNGMMYDNEYILEYGRQHLGPDRARHWFGIWNSYLSLLLNVGIIGIAAYAWFIKEMYRYAHLKNLAFAFIVMSLFSAITESWMAASMNAFTPMFFLYWAIQSQEVKSSRPLGA